VSIDADLRHITGLEPGTGFGRRYARALTVLAAGIERHRHAQPFAGTVRTTCAGDGLLGLGAIAVQRAVGGW
jgi:hypothetical protein